MRKNTRPTSPAKSASLTGLKIVRCLLALLVITGLGSDFCSIAPQVEAKSSKSSSKKKSTRKKSTAKKSTSKRSRGKRRSSSKSRAKKKPVVQKPTAEQLAAQAKRESAYKSLDTAYLLYDAGINARIAGDNALAISKLEEAWRKFDENKGYQKGGQSSTVISLVHYELAQAAEAQGDFSRARDSYARCLKVRPTYTQASVKLVHLLARKGQLELALATAKEACQASPKDPRGHLLVALMLDKLGRSTDAKQSDQEAESLLRVEGLVVPSATSQEKPVNKETVGKEAKKQLESDVMTDIDDDDSGAPLPGSDESED